MPTQAEFSLEEISKHNSRDDCWVIVDDKVFDVTEFLELHPGGESVLFKLSGGQDITDTFYMMHDEETITDYESLIVGVVKRSVDEQLGTLTISPADAAVTTKVGEVGKEVTKIYHQLTAEAMEKAYERAKARHDSITEEEYWALLLEPDPDNYLATALWRLGFTSRMADSYQFLEAVTDIVTEIETTFERNSITGHLVVDKTTWAVEHTLEGTQPAVTALLDKLKADPRFSDIEVVLSEEVLEREFESWAMEFEIKVPPLEPFVDRRQKHEEKARAVLAARRASYEKLQRAKCLRANLALKRASEVERDARTKIDDAPADQEANHTPPQSVIRLDV